MTVKLPIPRSIEQPNIKGDLGAFDGVQWRRLPVGADGEYLQAQAAAIDGTGVLWVALPGTAKGDMLLHNGTQLAAFPEGNDQEIMVVQDDEVTFKRTWKSIAQLITSAVKSGVMAAAAENTLTTLTFTTAFASAPQVVVSLGADPGAVLERLWVEQVTATSFKVQFDLAASTDAKDIHWIATLAGDP